MRHFNEGWFRREVRFLQQQFLQDGNLPAAKLPTTAQLGTEINSDLGFGPPTISFASGMTTGQIFITGRQRLGEMGDALRHFCYHCRVFPFFAHFLE